MKVLHVANFNLGRFGRNYYSFDYKLTNGFIRNGHFVYDFSYRDTARAVSLLNRKKFGTKKMNNKLLDTVTNLKPDLLVLGQAELIFPETLDKAREICPNLRIALWYVDTLKSRDDGKVGRLEPLVEKVDSFFCTSAGPLLSQFKPRRSASYMPNVTDPSIDILTNHKQKKFSHDVVFIGSDRHDAKRRHYLANFITQAKKAAIRVACFGSQGNPYVYGSAFFDALSSAPMSLSIGRITDVKWYTSDRIGQLTGNGLLTFSSEVRDFRELYSDDELVYFSDVDDLIEKILYYKEHDEERQRIAKNGYERAHRCYNVQRVARFIEEETFGRHSEQYEWLE